MKSWINIWTQLGLFLPVTDD